MGLPATKRGTWGWNQGLDVQVSGFTLLTAGALVSLSEMDVVTPKCLNSIVHVLTFLVLRMCLKINPCEGVVFVFKWIKNKAEGNSFSGC